MTRRIPEGAPRFGVGWPLAHSQPCLQFSQQISIRSASSACQCCEVRVTSSSQHTWRQFMATLPIYSFVHRSGQILLRTNEPLHQRTTTSAWNFLSSHVTLYIRCSCKSFLFNDGVPPKKLSSFASLPTVLRVLSVISGEPQHSKVSSSYIISWNLFNVS